MFEGLKTLAKTWYLNAIILMDMTLGLKKITVNIVYS